MCTHKKIGTTMTMLQPPTTLDQAITLGYIVRDSTSGKAWRAFHRWCGQHHQPFGFIELPTAWQQRRGAIVAMHLVITGTDASRLRFSSEVLAEARDLLVHYPAVGDRGRSVIRSASPLCIQHRSVFPDQAGHLAQALLALYRRGKETTGS